MMMKRLPEDYVNVAVLNNTVIIVNILYICWSK